MRLGSIIYESELRSCLCFTPLGDGVSSTLIIKSLTHTHTRSRVLGSRFLAPYTDLLYLRGVSSLSKVPAVTRCLLSPGVAVAENGEGPEKEDEKSRQRRIPPRIWLKRIPRESWDCRCHPTRSRRGDALSLLISLLAVLCSFVFWIARSRAARIATRATHLRSVS